MHFTVLVVGDNIDKKLAPYQENNMGDCPDEFLETDEDGDTYNPNSEWDWYVLGGRWSGMIKLKEPNKGEKGRPGIMAAPNTDPMVADSALMKDIDFEGMYTEAEGKAATMYDTVMGIFGELPVHKSHETITEEIKNKYSKDTPLSVIQEKARQLYREQPRLVAIDTAREADTNLFIQADEFLISKEEYVINARTKAFITHAVLNNGEWTNSDSIDDQEFNEFFKETLEGLSPDTRISIVDCHV